MNRKQVLSTLSGLLLSFVSHATIIDFNELANGEIVNGQYQLSHGVSIDATNLRLGQNNLAVAFDTSLINTQDPDLESPFSNINQPSLGIANPGNVLIIHENPNSCNGLICSNPDDEGRRPAGYFTINFSSAVLLESIDFFDIELAENGYTPQNAIHLFDAQNNEIFPADFYTPHTGGDNTWDRLNFDVAEVSSLRIHLNGSGAIDNIKFSVPEPGSIALFGLAVFGLVARRLK
ncbi:MULTISPECIES: PEP-CTERM sorting domain-containing protein [unclassified Agarivorans]|uniref:PEP-CTERM sorting domain-containing protein n=1 Tax=unclassified Agarivorans TaxID=2636026 RepID=UPI0026E3F6F9|nr:MULTISPECIES: PEP-CTERM sorting domain-containing protein [unclassified Agarivorans]MDO6685195.1 PEP-CTERM sorting domain-containing protein [Agarivorans sp. 3_MG-2023]MDO6715633.1 PEP-CTERM sorting domain-containing protein [Agarivorans sp. 2_MG-2023]